MAWLCPSFVCCEWCCLLHYVIVCECPGRESLLKSTENSRKGQGRWPDLSFNNRKRDDTKFIETGVTGEEQLWQERWHHLTQITCDVCRWAQVPAWPWNFLLASSKHLTNLGHYFEQPVPRHRSLPGPNYSNLLWHEQAPRWIQRQKSYSFPLNAHLGLPDNYNICHIHSTSIS